MTLLLHSEKKCHRMVINMHPPWNAMIQRNSSFMKLKIPTSNKGSAEKLTANVEAYTNKYG